MQKGCIARTIQSNETSLFPLFFILRKKNDESCLRSLTNMQVNVSCFGNCVYGFIGAGVVLDG